MISTGTPYLDPCVAAWCLKVSGAVKRRIYGVRLLAGCFWRPDQAIIFLFWEDGIARNTHPAHKDSF